MALHLKLPDALHDFLTWVVTGPEEGTGIMEKEDGNFYNIIVYILELYRGYIGIMERWKLLFRVWDGLGFLRFRVGGNGNHTYYTRTPGVQSP